MPRFFEKRSIASGLSRIVAIGAFQPWTFGFQGRAASGAASLANLYDVNVDVAVNAHLSVSPYLGYAAGKSVIQAIYPKGKDGHLEFLEATYRF